MQRDGGAVLLTGLFGTGKSSVAIEMADRLEEAGRPYAVIDLDWLCWGWAGGDEGSEHRMLLANLEPVFKNYLAAGVRFVILARSIRTREELEGLRHVVSIPLRVVELTLPFAEIERRLSTDITAARQDDLRDAAAWLEAGEGAGLGDISIANDRPIGDVTADVLAWLGWSWED